MNASFPKTLRLRKSVEFDRVFERRRSQADGLLIVYGRENDLGVPRLGLVVSRKAGGAVERARWKRCLREAFRLSQHDLPAGVDYVVLPRRGATPTTPAVRRSFAKLAERLRRSLGATRGDG